MDKKVIVKGYRALCYTSIDTLLVSKRNQLFIYDVSKDSILKIACFKIPFYLEVMSYLPLLRRLLRLEFRNGLKINESEYLLVFKNTVLRFNSSTALIIREEINERGLSFTKIKGLKGFDDMICFGEYKENFSKAEISIHRFYNNHWGKIFTFEEGTIEHVHAIIPDYINSRVWILTGDFGNSACIWLAEDNFKSVRPLLSGSQMYRSCVAFPYEGGLLYATDSQIDKNYVNYLHLDSSGDYVVDTICSLNGPCIYGTALKEDFVFSTTVEPYCGLGKINIWKGLLMNKPGSGILTPNVEIIKLSKNLKVETLNVNTKDPYPFVFQFGTITFPTDDFNHENLVFYNMSLKNNNNCTEIWNIN